MTDLEDNFKLNNMWKSKKKIMGKNIELPLETYKNQCQNRSIQPEYIKLKELREKLFSIRLDQCSQNASPLWSMNDLEKVLSKLKKGKAIDPYGMMNV